MPKDRTGKRKRKDSVIRSRSQLGAGDVETTRAPIRLHDTVDPGDAFSFLGLKLRRKRRRVEVANSADTPGRNDEFEGVSSTRGEPIGESLSGDMVHNPKAALEADDEGPSFPEENKEVPSFPQEPAVDYFKAQFDDSVGSNVRNLSGFSATEMSVSPFEYPEDANGPRRTSGHLHLRLRDKMEAPSAGLDMIASQLRPSLQGTLHLLNSQGRSKVAPNSAEESGGADSCFAPLQRALAPFLLQYRDLLYVPRCVSRESGDAISALYVSHVLNHVFKARRLVLKNNQRLHHDEKDKDNLDLRDQGFTRPRVLVLLPFRSTALKVVNTMLSLSGCKQIENRKRFVQEYSPLDNHVDADDPRKPGDFNSTFSGNTDDNFRIGIQFSGKKAMKLYSKFFSSDVLVASPLGLHTAMLAKYGSGPDFLSSIEIVIVDHCDVLLQQNFELVETIFQNLNQIPRTSHPTTDFLRVRNFNLDGRASEARQTILLSGFLFPQLLTLASGSKNVAGTATIVPSYGPGSISGTPNGIPQTFHRFDVSSFKDESEARWKHFREFMMPKLGKRTVVYVSSYFDFLRMRNSMEEAGLEFVELSEYTSSPRMNRARSHFASGARGIVLMTERFFFYRRAKLKGVQRVIFYSLPSPGPFYPEIVSQLANDTGNPTCDVLFSRYDRLKLDRIVGNTRAEMLCTVVPQSTWMFA